MISVSTPYVRTVGHWTRGNASVCAHRGIVGPLVHHATSLKIGANMAQHWWLRTASVTAVKGRPLPVTGEGNYAINVNTKVARTVVWWTLPPAGVDVFQTG